MFYTGLALPFFQLSVQRWSAEDNASGPTLNPEVQTIPTVLHSERVFGGRTSRGHASVNQLSVMTFRQQYKPRHTYGSLSTVHNTGGPQNGKGKNFRSKVHLQPPQNKDQSLAAARLSLCVIVRPTGALRNWVIMEKVPQGAVRSQSQGNREEETQLVKSV